jgi:hypothetical protein
MLLLTRESHQVVSYYFCSSIREIIICFRQFRRRIFVCPHCGRSDDRDIGNFGSSAHRRRQD